MPEVKSRILVVDDDNNAREMMERRLARSGYDCVTAPSADEAASLLEQETFDLMLLDIVMPGKFGTQFLPEVVKQYPDMAVVMVSAVGNDSIAANSMRAGAYDYIAKPVDFEELITRVYRAIDRRNLVIKNRQYQQMLDQVGPDRTEYLERQARNLQDAKQAFTRLDVALSKLSTQIEELSLEANEASPEDVPAHVELKRVMDQSRSLIQRALDIWAKRMKL